MFNTGDWSLLVSLILTISIHMPFSSSSNSVLRYFSMTLRGDGTVILLFLLMFWSCQCQHINPLFVHVTTITVPPLSLHFFFFPPTNPWSFTRGRSFMSQYIAHMGISRRRLKKERSITEETSRISNRSVSHFTSPSAFETLTNNLVFVELVLATDADTDASLEFIVYTK